MKFVVLTDTHFVDDRGARVGSRCAGIADILSLRAVHRLNRYIKPDMAVVLGDMVNDGNAPDAAGQFSRMKSVFELLDCPVIFLPGNHDGDPETFYSVFPKPPECVDVAGVRFVGFADPEEPGYNARRGDDGKGRLKAARCNWSGPLVALQHVPVFPPGEVECPYNYVDVNDVIDEMAEAGVTLSVSGHFHRGFDLIQTEGPSYLAAPALCEAPFPYLIVTIDGDGVRVTREHLAMPEELGLVDTHVHTQLAYCNENLDAGLILQLAPTFGLASMRFAEHSGHLYFDRSGYGSCGSKGLAAITPENDRTGDYFDLLREVNCPAACVGIEIDACDDGSPLIRPEDAARTAFRIGAVHQLSSLRTPQPEYGRVCDDFLATTRKFLEADIHTLAHPFRVFRRARLPIPADLFGPMARMLASARVAAEINFHTNDPDPRFIRECLDADVKLTFGSDAHNLYEVGEFYPHLKLLHAAGYTADIGDVLLQP